MKTEAELLELAKQLASKASRAFYDLDDDECLRRATLVRLQEIERAADQFNAAVEERDRTEREIRQAACDHAYEPQPWTLSWVCQKCGLRKVPLP